MQIHLGSSNVDLMDVYVQDFGDNYHKFGDEPSTELEKEVRRIRRRYKDISDYNRALLAYNEYMGLLVQKYGGPELFELKLKNNQITDFVPPSPGVKVNELNKFVMKNKILISKRNTKELNMKTLALVEKDLVKQDPSNVPLTFPKPDLDKNESKYVKRMIKGGEIKSILRGRSSLRKNAPSISYLEEYFYTKNAEENKKDEVEQTFSLSEYADGSFATKLKDTRGEERQTVFFRGQYIDQDSADELALYKDLGKIGWNSMKIMRDLGVSKKITKAMKKGEKKESKKEKKKRKTDNLVVSLMTDGGFDTFEDFQAEMESFKASDVFRR